jgi:hypothetical protein
MKLNQTFHWQTVANSEAIRVPQSEDWEIIQAMRAEHRDELIESHDLVRCSDED